VSYAAPVTTFAAPATTYAAPTLASSVQYTNVQSTFSAIDTNNDGIVTRIELANALNAGILRQAAASEVSSLSRPPSKTKTESKAGTAVADAIEVAVALDEVFNQIDTDHDGLISQPELVTAMEQGIIEMPTPSMSRPVTTQSEAIGRVGRELAETAPSSELIRQMFPHTPPAALTQEADELFQKIDTNKDGIISLEEFEAAQASGIIEVTPEKAGLDDSFQDFGEEGPLSPKQKQAAEVSLAADAFQQKQEDLAFAFFAQAEESRDLDARLEAEATEANRVVRAEESAKTPKLAESFQQKQEELAFAFFTAKEQADEALVTEAEQDRDMEKRLRYEMEDLEGPDKTGKVSFGQATSSTAVPATTVTLSPTWTRPSATLTSTWSNTSGWRTDRFVSAEEKSRFRVDEEAVASWKMDSFGKRASVGAWLMSQPPALKAQVEPNRVRPGTAASDELHVPTTPLPETLTPMSEEIERQENASAAGTAIPDAVEVSALEAAPFAQPEAEREVTKLPVQPAVNFYPAPKEAAKPSQLGHPVPGVRPVSVPSEAAVSLFTPKTDATTALQSPSRPRPKDSSRVRRSDMGGLIDGSLSQDQPAISAEMPWVKVPSFSMFLTTDPLQSKLSWDRQPAGGTWVTRPQTAAKMPEESGQKCSACGNIFLADAVFCRNCGAKRPVEETSMEAAVSSTKPAGPTAPRQPFSGTFMRSDIEMSRDPTAAPTAPWLARPSPGTWLSHAPLVASAPLNGSWLRKPAAGKWISAPALRATTAVRKLDLDAINSMAEGDLPPQLVALRAAASQAEAEVVEAKNANEALFSENVNLREELGRLLQLRSPHDSPVTSARPPL